MALTLLLIGLATSGETVPASKVTASIAAAMAAASASLDIVADLKDFTLKKMNWYECESQLLDHFSK